MKITMVSGKNPFAAEPSGTMAYAGGLINAISDKKIEVTLISSEIGEAERQKYQIVCIPIRMKKVTSIRFLTKLIFKAPFLKLHKNSIIHVHRPDFMLPFIIFHRNNPKICTLHGIPNVGIKTRKSFIIWAMYNVIENLSLRHIDRLIAVNQMTKDYYSKKGQHLRDKILVIPVGVDTNIFKPLDKGKMREKFKFDQRETIILSAGRFSIEKRVDLLLEAFKDLKSEIPKARLILLGEGPEEKKLRKIIKIQAIKGVTFMKPIRHEKVPEIINCADVLALCSSFEGMPTVVLEALSCGVPVVSTVVGDVNKVVIDGKTGQLIRYQTRESIKNALLKVARNGRDDYSENCKIVAKQYSWETISNKIIKTYATVLKDG